VLDFEDEKVKDRWSRNIGVMGIDALKKQAKSVLIMFGLNGVAVEIAKNIILSGVKKFIIYDDQVTTYKDLSGQFFLTEEDLG
jgi:molybdopterin/thiamine biosynthesis adenylyltransferase